MKEILYNKMKSLFHVVEHDYKEVSPLEITIMRLARGNTFNLRVTGLNEIKEFRKQNPDCSITFKPNHLSEADFIMLCVLFREHNMRVLSEGGSNLFIDNIDVFKDLLPNFVNPGFKDTLNNNTFSISDYLSERGAFKVFRTPEIIKQDDGSEIKIGPKEMLSLSRAYRYHLVKDREMYVTYPGFSIVKSDFNGLQRKNEVKTGRSYSGKLDGFLHHPFQMDIEASLFSNVDVYIVGVNIAYSPVLEDCNFRELENLFKSGAGIKEIYCKDIGYIISEFCRDKIKGDMSIKFSKPEKIDTSAMNSASSGKIVKDAAHAYARSTFKEVLSMQPVFPANIFFTSFDEAFNKMPLQKFKERIHELCNSLYARAEDIDLHYLLGYDKQIISPDEIINRTLNIFNSDIRRIAGVEGDSVLVYDKDVAQQYKNHTDHIFNIREEQGYTEDDDYTRRDLSAAVEL